jgi:serine/threonine protein kinase
MAPEQMEHPGDVDHRADIYALGVVFYQMLTGEMPGKRIEPPSSKVHIDVRLDEVVLRAMEKKPELRYQQVSVLKTQVETIAATPRPSDKAAPKSNSLLKESLWYVSTPEHLHTFLGRLLYNSQAKGELRLDKETLSFDSCTWRIRN